MRIWPIACLILALGAPLAAAATPADARFEAIYKREWAWRENEFPGKERGDAPIADRLAKVDAASQARRLAYWEDVRKQLDAIPERDLSPDEAVNYEVYVDQI